MADAAPASASLSAGMIRRAPPVVAPPAQAEVGIAPAAEPAEAAWRDDLRLFGMTWAAGFVFFTVFLA